MLSTNSDGIDEMATYLGVIGKLLGSETRRASFAMYVAGLMSSLPRKTVESIAAMQCRDLSRMDADHQQLLHVIGQANWEDAPVRTYAAKYAVDAITKVSPLQSWIIDDTGFPKKGSHSVGVQRQYSGTLGKIDNCQIGVSLVAASSQAHVPVDFALYLPESWTNDDERRTRAKIPTDVQFKTKPELALAIMQGALEAGLERPPIVLADSAYGNNSLFRQGLRDMKLRFGVGIQGDTKMWWADRRGRKRGPATSADMLAKKAAFRRVTWGQGTKGPLTSMFAFLRVVVMRDELANSDSKADAMWLVIECPDDAAEPTKFLLTDLPRLTSHRKIAWLLHQRYRTERAY
jgi:SRSO17 transposase